MRSIRKGLCKWLVVAGCESAAHFLAQIVVCDIFCTKVQSGAAASQHAVPTDYILISRQSLLRWNVAHLSRVYFRCHRSWFLVSVCVGYTSSTLHFLPLSRTYTRFRHVRAHRSPCWNALHPSASAFRNFLHGKNYSPYETFPAHAAPALLGFDRSSCDALCCTNLCRTATRLVPPETSVSDVPCALRHSLCSSSDRTLSSAVTAVIRRPTCVDTTNE